MDVFLCVCVFLFSMWIVNKMLYARCIKLCIYLFRSLSFFIVLRFLSVVVVFPSFAFFVVYQRCIHTSSEHTFFWSSVPWTSQ